MEWLIIVALILLLTIWTWPSVRSIGTIWIFIWLIFGGLTCLWPGTHFVVGIAAVLFTIYAWIELIGLALVPSFSNASRLIHANWQSLILLAANYLIAVPRLSQLIHFGQLTAWPILNKIVTMALFANLAVLILGLIWVGLSAIVSCFRFTPDFIVVLGAQLQGQQPGPILQQRLKTVRQQAMLFQQAQLILTGHGSETGKTQAAAMRRFLTHHGIDQSRILTDEQATNTRQNISNANQLIKQHWPKHTSVRVAIITSNFHVGRTWLYTNHYRNWQVRMVAAKTPGNLLPLAATRDFLGVLRDYWWGFVIIILLSLVLAILY